jgi:hypothetical protein
MIRRWLVRSRERAAQAWRDVIEDIRDATDRKDVDDVVHLAFVALVRRRALDRADARLDWWTRGGTR